MFGTIICIFSSGEIPFNIPNKAVEFVGLVLTLSGSWGMVDSLLSLLAGGGSLLILSAQRLADSVEDIPFLLVLGTGEALSFSAAHPFLLECPTCSS